jgi:DUF4097 and DUF4098 domain-containing protein YvlB
MRRLSRWTSLLLPIVCLVALTACDIAYSAIEGKFDRTLNVTGAVDLEVSTGSGSIAIRAGNSSIVQIRGIIRARDDWRSKAEDKIRYLTDNPPIEQSGNTIRIGQIDNDAYRNNVSISYEIIVPSETKVQSKTGSGSQKIEDIRGSVDAATGSGSITMYNIGSDVVAHTGSGGIEINRVSGSVEARTGSGSIHADNIAGGIKASTGSGSIRLGQISAERGGIWDVEAHTGSGSIEATGIEGAFRADTGSGGIRASGNPGGDWELRASSGGITLQIDAEAAFDLDAHSSSGAIHVNHPVTVSGTMNKHELRGKVRGGGHLIEARTSSGSISIR